MRTLCLLFLSAILWTSCSQDNSNTSSNTSSEQSIQQFKLASGTNIDFDNHIEETIEFSTLRNHAILHGGGVGILDINNDGLQDIYFAGNLVKDKLYLNQGNLKFKDISTSAGISTDDTWSSGIAVVDINADGFQDVYVCKFLYDDKSKRVNKLYINNQDNTFTERAREYGLADDGYSVMANFLDYDQDGDLDAYIVNQPPYTKELKKKVKPTDFQYTDKLYRNDGGKFTDVTEEAGVLAVNYSLSATVNDFNGDNLPDIYVASDYEEPDMLYQNNGDGTFTNVVDDALKHMSNFSMGADVADINNDGHMDIFTADMTAEGNFRNKTNMSSMAVEKFWGLVAAGYHYQFMFNSMQLNNGNGTFSEMAQMAGISKTDWSWAPLFVDADQDGYKDLFVTNGILKEIRNKDYQKKLAKKVKAKQAESGKGVAFNPLELTKMAPSVKIKNKAYRNLGDLTFDAKTDDWGFDKPGWSQGMAYADLDNDGDLDMIISNMNEAADIYINQANTTNNHYISVKVNGIPNNTAGNNTKVKITYGTQQQVVEITPYRGYMSSCESVAHFGLGEVSTIDKLEVTFPNGKIISRQNVSTDQKLIIDYDANAVANGMADVASPLFLETNNNTQIVYQDNAYDDYMREVLIPYKASMLGPHMAQGDIDGDGDDDFYMSGPALQAGQLAIQQSDGSFKLTAQAVFEKYKNVEDGCAEFLDVNGDGALDLFVCGGGSEYQAESAAYQDRIFLNNGKGEFLDSDILPPTSVSSGSVSAHDYDGDGDIDLFVGGRQHPGKYGQKVSSTLLQNNGDRFEDATPDILKNLGMATGSTWADIDGDGSAELITCGEWMPIQAYRFVNGQLEAAEVSSLSNTEGLWNTIQSADIDGDGDLDLIAGNYGLNYKYKASPKAPLELYVDDFDGNGSNDVYLGYHDEADGKLYPVRGRQCSSEQMPFVEEKFANYEEFGKATIIDVLDGKMDGTTKLKAITLAHTAFINDGKGNFEARPLPNRSQVAPVYDMVIRDIDGDGNIDILAAGNFHQREVETTRSDAGIGTLMLGLGNGSFSVAPPSQVGILANNDVRALAYLKNSDGKDILAVANNGSRMQFYQHK